MLVNNSLLVFNTWDCAWCPSESSFELKTVLKFGFKGLADVFPLTATVDQRTLNLQQIIIYYLGVIEILQPFSYGSLLMLKAWDCALWPSESSCELKTVLKFGFTYLADMFPVTIT